MKSEFNLKITRDEDGVLNFHHLNNDFRFYEIIGALEVYKHSLVEYSRGQAIKIKKQNDKTKRP